MKTFEREKVAEEFGRFVREARESRGLTQSEVAQKIGCSRSYYTMIEIGTREIYFTMALKICSALGLNINDFAKRF